MLETFAPCAQCYVSLVLAMAACAPATSRLLSFLWDQVSQRQVVNNILHILDAILQPITATAQAVVLEIENLEASMQVLDELVDEQRTLVVAQSDCVACETCLTMLAMNWHRLHRTYRRTSSSTSVMSECKYSSSERWNSSRSLRFTGTV